MYPEIVYAKYYAQRFRGRVAAGRQRRRTEGERGASTVETVIITAVLAALTLFVAGLIYTKVTDKSKCIDLNNEAACAKPASPPAT